MLDGDFFHDSLMSAHYPHRNVYNADAAHTLPAVLIEALVQSAPDRLVLLPAALPALPRGRLTGIRTRFGAALDLTWTPDGGTAVLRPDRTHRITLWTPAGAEPLDLGHAARNASSRWRRRRDDQARPPPMEGTPWHRKPRAGSSGR